MLEPVEFLVPKSEEETAQKLPKLLEHCVPMARRNALPVGDAGFTDPHISAASILQYFDEDGPPVPPVLQRILDRDSDYVELLMSLGAVIQFLIRAKLDAAIFPMSSYELVSFDASCHQTRHSAVDGPVDGWMLQDEMLDRVLLDSSALENLEVFLDSNGRTGNSLLASLDHCVTSFGKRLLKKWLGQPLVSIAAIQERQDAIQDLLTTAAVVVGSVRRSLASLGDLERLLVRLHSTCQTGFFEGREAQHVVLYEDMAVKKVQALVKALMGLQTVQGTISAFHHVKPRLISPLLHRILTPGEGFPDIQQQLNDLMASADWKEAQESGRILPSPVQLLAVVSVVMLSLLGPGSRIRRCQRSDERSYGEAAGLFSGATETARSTQG